jgi:hypothetical protein
VAACRPTGRALLDLRDRANQPPDTGGGSTVTMANEDGEGGW